MEIISKIRINKKTGQKTATIPKQKETKNWKERELVEIRKVKII